jgi:hypothetical protein
LPFKVGSLASIPLNLLKEQLQGIVVLVLAALLSMISFTQLRTRSSGSATGWRNTCKYHAYRALDPIPSCALSGFPASSSGAAIRGELEVCGQAGENFSGSRKWNETVRADAGVPQGISIKFMSVSGQSCGTNASGR